MIQIQRQYVAGVCNISKEEGSLRLAVGWIGTGLTVAAALAFVALHVPALWRLTLFLPALTAASGFLQASLHFCANYGWRGVFNITSEVGSIRQVGHAESAKRDRAKAVQILTLAVVIGLIVAVAGFFLP